MLRFANRAAQAGIYKTGTPNYVDCSVGAAAAGSVTIPVKAIDDSWADGDTVPVFVAVDEGNWWLGVGTWDETNSYIELTTEEDSAGALSDAAAVTITTTITVEAIETIRTLATDVELIEEATTARTLSATDHGKTIRCTSASAVAVTIADTLPVGFHVLLIQEGAGTVTIDSQNTDTLNGVAAGTGVAIADQYKSAYVYQPAEGAWVVVA